MEVQRAALLTVDDLMKLGSEARVEVVDGELVEMSPVGGLHHFVGGNVYDVLGPFVKQHRLGFVFMDGLIYLLTQEGAGLKGARVPDVSFVRKADIPPDWDIEKPYPGAPTLAVEIVSPTDSPEDVLDKVRDYLDAGSEQVWLLYPRRKELHQYRQGVDTVRTYRGDEELDVSELFPGLRIIVSELFVVPELS